MLTENSWLDVRNSDKYVLNIIDSLIADHESYETIYDELLSEVFKAKYGVNNSDESLHLKRCLEWLHSTDFYTAPASTRFHNHEPGGLLHHTIDVVRCILDLHTCNKFSKVPIVDAVFVALVHDWCKIGLYESYVKNVKDDTGVWRQEMAYKHKDTPFICFGHGVSSLYLISRFIQLTTEEALAIRWHMGEYNVADNEMSDLHQANETYPLVQMLQFADRLSITKF